MEEGDLFHYSSMARKEFEGYGFYYCLLLKNENHIETQKNDLKTWIFNLYY